MKCICIPGTSMATMVCSTRKTIYGGVIKISTLHIKNQTVKTVTGHGEMVGCLPLLCGCWRSYRKMHRTANNMKMTSKPWQKRWFRYNARTDSGMPVFTIRKIMAEKKQPALHSLYMVWPGG